MPLLWLFHAGGRFPGFRCTAVGDGLFSRCTLAVALGGLRQFFLRAAGTALFASGLLILLRAGAGPWTGLAFAAVATLAGFFLSAAIVRISTPSPTIATPLSPGLFLPAGALTLLPYAPVVSGTGTWSTLAVTTPAAPTASASGSCPPAAAGCGTILLAAASLSFPGAFAALRLRG